MLDVVFIVPIFFIATASFTKESRVDVNRPDSASTESAKSTPSILIRITVQDEVEIELSRVDIRRATANV